MMRIHDRIHDFSRVLYDDRVFYAMTKCLLFLLKKHLKNHDIQMISLTSN